MKIPCLALCAAVFSVAVSSSSVAAMSGTHGHDIVAGPLDTATINGKPPPGRVLPLQDVTLLIDELTSSGQRVVVARGTRKAGTRAAIHIHEHGGFTCVLSGEITIFVDGREPKKQPAGTCYYMPAGILMSAVNLGDADAVLTDNFIAPAGAPLMVVREPGYPAE